MTNVSLSGTGARKFKGVADLGDQDELASVPEIEQVYERLPDDSSLEIEVEHQSDSVTCKLTCFSAWGKFVAKRVDTSVHLALASACRSVLRSIDFVRRSCIPPLEA